MNTYPEIASAAGPTARVIGWQQVEQVPAATLPVRAICSGQFSVGTAACGLPELLDPQGRGCGLFANKQMAEDTAALLSQ